MLFMSHTSSIMMWQKSLKISRGRNLTTWYTVSVEPETKGDIFLSIGTDTKSNIFPKRNSRFEGWFLLHYSIATRARKLPANTVRGSLSTIPEHFSNHPSSRRYVHGISGRKK